MLNDRRRLGFSLMELLVVIAIILVLMGIVVPALYSARTKRLITGTHVEVNNIVHAANLYYESLNQFPPDTGTPGGSPYATGTIPDTALDTDDEAIVKYLGKKVIDKRTNVEHGPFLNCKINQIKLIAGKEIYVDLFGMPYQMDCKHSKVSADKTGPNVGKVTMVGEPYPPGTLDEDQKVDLKVWSMGPDKMDANGSNVKKGKGYPIPDPKDEDNITNWAD